MKQKELYLTSDFDKLPISRQLFCFKQTDKVCLRIWKLSINILLARQE